jgi:hypothetical protein
MEKSNKEERKDQTIALEEKVSGKEGGKIFSKGKALEII